MANLKAQKIITWSLAAVVVAGLAWYKTSVLDKGKIAEPTAAAAASKPKTGGPMPVEYLVAERRDIANPLFATGTLLPNEQLDLKVEMTGRIEQILFSEGQFVKKGQLLLKINDSELQAQLKKNQAELQLARDNERRQKQLLDAQAIGESDYDLARNRIQTLTADAEFLQTQLAKVQLFAPFDGVMGIRQIAPGGYVQAGTTIAPLRQLNPLKLEFSLPEKYVSEVRVGQSVEFSTEDSGQKFSAKVNLLDPQIDAATRTLRVRAICSNPSGKLMSGAFAKVVFPLKSSGQIMVPTQAVVPTATGKQVFVIKNGKATPVEVVGGLRTESEIQLESGVQPGDSIITSGLLVMRPGMAVVPKK